MVSLLTELKEYIDKHELIGTSDKVLVAVSGGIDSVVLTHLLDELKYKIGIAHVNFQLRGTESDKDEQLVKDLSKGLGVPWHVQKFEANTYAQKHGISIQMAARELRYRWFEELCRTHDYQKIAIAHHLNDVLETLLLNVTKGTGIAGLHGIAVKKDRIIRPLLFTTKDRIKNYANENKLDWREDESNLDDKYQRNLIRNQVVPLLKNINPNIEYTTKETVEILSSVERIYRSSLEQLKQKLITREGDHLIISKSNLKSTDPALLYDILNEYGFNLDQCRSLLQEAFNNVGKVFESTTYKLNVDRDRLIISPLHNMLQTGSIEEQQKSIMVAGRNWVITNRKASEYVIPNDLEIGVFDIEKLAFPLAIRNWQKGDRFYPLGMMMHSKKVSDFLIDNKVPRNLKQNTMVLTSKEEICWVVGFRIDDRFKVTETTERILEIKIK